VVWLVITGLTFALLAGHGPWAGRELFAISRAHGVNVGDLPVIGAWVVGSGACWHLWRRG
jgi:hypothetical protein